MHRSIRHAGARWVVATLVAGAGLLAAGSPALGTTPSPSPSPSPSTAPSGAQPIDLAPKGGEGRAVRVDRHGDIVGSISAVPDGPLIGQLWSGHGYTATSRGVLGPHALAMNNHGDAVGCTPGGVGLLWRGSTLTQVSRAGQSICFYGINDSDQVVGTTAGPTGATRSFLWQNGHFTDLGLPADLGSYPVGINNRGQVVGRLIGATTSLPVRTFVWTAGKWTDIGSLGGNESIPIAINNNGTVIGTSTLTDGRKHPFSWHARPAARTGTITDLLAGTGVEDNNSFANALNDSGDIVGTVSNRPVLWRHGTMTYLSTATGEATAINARGQVAGAVRTSTDESEVFRVTAGKLTILPKLAGQNYGYAVGIDDRGRVVGNVTTDPGNLGHTVVWK